MRSAALGLPVHHRPFVYIMEDFEGGPISLLRSHLTRATPIEFMIVRTSDQEPKP